ncbi:interleukin-1 receptor-associated kinase 4-like [Pollicipes pollicipes]|uniref:interleukin-1 receptor-associated kinase 4-like n=1 Tax=Pollicipes pollicipes TaxID=41117 RepID=UPI00188531B8|nr:interleukin-1 receptor-associated kinase 4-like [Pollicipes pollicipes]
MSVRVRLCARSSWPYFHVHLQRGMTSLRGNAELRRLPAHVRNTLGQMLAIRGAWKTLMGRVRRPGSNVALFTNEHVQLVSEESARSGRSETDVLLDEWGTWGRRHERPTVDDLVMLLTELSLYRAADYINVNVLEGERRTASGQELERSPEEPELEPEPELGPEPGPEPPADIRHFSFAYLEKITNEFDDRAVAAGGCRLGAGAYGTVYLGTCETAERLAVKRLVADVEAVRRQFRTEVEVMSSFRHVNLLELLGFSCDGAYNCLVYSYMVNGSLQDRLACKEDSPPLAWERRLAIAVGTARGVVHLHTSRERPLIHRDIKSANILLDTDFTPKVGDFGLAREVSGSRTTNTLLTTTVLGTSAYMPPEAFRGDVSVRLDSFSFGIEHKADTLFMLTRITGGVDVFGVVSLQPEDAAEVPARATQQVACLVRRLTGEAAHAWALGTT